MADQPSNDNASTDNGVNSRRDFLKTGSALLAAGTFASTLGIARNAHAAGSDEIKIGLIGCGGRGTGAAIQAMNTAGATKLIAVADAFASNAQNCVNEAKRAHKDKVDVPKERMFSGLDAYRKLLQTNCDLVILATPPGFRPYHFEAAVNAGKDIFMEKPVATDAAGVRRVLAANEIAKQKNLAVAVGLQRRHEVRYNETIKKLQDGGVGDTQLTRVYWNSAGVWTRPRKPGQSELEYQVQNWYYFNWLCGDHIVEQHIHNLDVINWLKGAYPVTANGMGGRQVRTGKENGEIYDHFFVEYTYGDGTKMYSQCRHIPGCFDRVAEYAHGTDGMCDIGRGIIFDRKGKKTWQSKGSEGGHQQEHHHLFAKLRKGEKPNEAEYGAKSTMTAIFGRMAAYSGQELNWDSCLNSNVSLGGKDFLAFSETAPLQPNKEGHYAIPMPGSTKVV